MAKYTTLLLATVAAFALAGPLPVAAEENKPAETEQLLPAIMVTPVTERAMVDRIDVSGSIMPNEEVYVAPLVEGLQIADLMKDVGDHVTKGEVLAQLNADTLLLQKSQLEANKARVEAAGAQAQAQVIEARTNADESERQAKRAETLALSGTIPRAQADQARAAATAAAARVNSAEQAIVANKADMKVIESQIADIELRLTRTAVKAPVDGVVTARNARIGAIASGAGQPLFMLMRDGKVELEADVAESDILKIAPGQTAEIVMAGGAARSKGTVRRIDPELNMQTRLGKVRIVVEDSDKARAGMFATAEVIVAERTTLSLPLTAVAIDKTGSYVRKVENGRIKMVNVETGIVDGENIEIASGLKAGDEVVLKAGAYVRDGDRINPVRKPLAQVN